MYSQSGGAQYRQATRPENDLLTVFAEAFDRDASGTDFSIPAIIAHEVGHQLLLRHPKLADRLAGRLSLASEEILASVLGAIIAPTQVDRDHLLAKAGFELTRFGVSPTVAVERLNN